MAKKDNVDGNFQIPALFPPSPAKRSLPLWRVDRQLEIECAAGAVFFIIPLALYPGLAPMHAGDTADDRQAQTRAAAFEHGFSR